MKFKVYLSIILGIFLLGTVPGYFHNAVEASPSTADAGLKSRLEQAAAQVAERLMVGHVATWQMYGRSGNYLYMQGLDSEGSQVIIVVFDERMYRPTNILYVCSEVSSFPIADRSPRALAAYWLGRLEDNRENPFSWTRDGNSSKWHYFSTWQNSTHRASIGINKRNGQWLSIRLSPSTELPEEEAKLARL